MRRHFFAVLSVAGVALLSVALVPGQAQAQGGASLALAAQPPAGSVPSASTNPLTIATPPGATVTFEMDGRDTDLLGMVKDLLSGVDKGMVNSAVRPRGGVSSFLGDQQISGILKDVRHLRVVSYKKPTNAAAGQPDPNNLAGTPGDALSFYEPKLVQEGGRRLLYSAEGTRVLVMGFDAPRGMAVIVDDGNKVTVARTEGNINTKALSSLVAGFAGGETGAEAVGGVNTRSEAVAGAAVKRPPVKKPVAGRAIRRSAPK